MPSYIAHVVAGAAVATPFISEPSGRNRWLMLGVAAAVVSDIDFLLAVIPGFDAVVHHRGILHSLAFALAFGLAAWAVARAGRSAQAIRIGACGSIAVLSHVLLDAMSRVGGGVEAFAPFSTTRVTLFGQPIGATRFANNAMGNLSALVIDELVWVGVPAFVLVMVATRLRARRIASSGMSP